MTSANVERLIRMLMAVEEELRADHDRVSLRESLAHLHLAASPPPGLHPRRPEAAQAAGESLGDGAGCGESCPPDRECLDGSDSARDARLPSMLLW